VLSLLFIGSGILGIVALQEFALALLIGMVSGVLSSIFVATPLLAWLKRDTGRKSHRPRLLGDDLRAAVMGAGVTSRAGEVVSDEADGVRDDPGDRVLVGTAVAQPADKLLTHPPRPRKKKRR
jgi:preprotein translocase subunit SecF